MAVQAHHPRDFCTRIQNNRNALDQLESHHHQLRQGVTNPLLFNPVGFAAVSNPQSELTMNGGCGSKKRNREESSSAMDLTMPIHGFVGGCDPNVTMGSVADPSIPIDRMRALDSVGRTSTSGRISYASAAAASSPMAQDPAALLLYRQSLEMDALIRYQNERLRLGLAQAQKRRCRSLISLLVRRLAEKLEEKDAELEMALRKNAELEEGVRQATSENQIWFNLARSSEAVVAGLRSSLERILLQNAVGGDGAVRAKEGFGDGDGAAFAADDAQSCCFEGEGEGEMAGGAVGNAGGRKRRRGCKACGGGDVGAVLLPCRHLCVCVDCEPGVDTCPICHVVKDSSLRIFMP